MDQTITKGTLRHNGNLVDKKNSQNDTGGG